jgi:predicted transcriptional regulator
LSLLSNPGLLLERSKPSKKQKREFRNTDRIKGEILLLLFKVGPLRRTTIFQALGVTWKLRTSSFDLLLKQGLIERVPMEKDVNRRYKGMFRITKKGLEALGHHQALNKLYNIPEPRIVELARDMQVPGKEQGEAAEGEKK